MTKILILITRLVSIPLLMICTINNVLADPGKLVNSPLFASTNNAPPNIFFEVDDSGSMDWDILTKRHWSDYAYNSDTSNSGGEEVSRGLFRGYTGSKYGFFHYIFDNSDSVYTNNCTGSFGLTLETCDVETDWRIKSSSVNIAYYNHNITYKPWVKGDGGTLDDAVFTLAKSNPQPETDGYGETRNLNDFIYHVWTDTHGFDEADGRPKSKKMNKTTGPNNLVDWWDEHKRYTVTESSIIVDQVTYTGRGTVETFTNLATLTGSGTHQLLGGKTIENTKQNIANWYQYYRKRSFVAKASIAKVISKNPTYLYGLNFINNSTFPYKNATAKLIEVPSATSSKTHNVELVKSLFTLKWPDRGTPLRKGLERVGKYFDNTDGKKNPIIESCQKNFTILFTDGYWNGGTPSSSIGDSDQDGRSITVADVAQHYYSTDLSALEGHQEMVTFTVAFGLKGILKDTDGSGWPNPELTKSSSGWGDPIDAKDESPEKIDDLWHAAFNSTGTFVSAETPEDVAKALENALANIGDRVGSATSIAFNTTTLETNSSVFLAEFSGSGGQWTGDIKSFTFNAGGKISSTADWSAATKLQNKAESSRKIFTYNKTTGKSVPFLWTSLIESQKNDLRVNPDGSSSQDDGDDDAKAKERLLYLRGKRTNEVSDNGITRGNFSFRKRYKLLGDIIHSSPVFVQKPELFWPSSAAPFPTGSGQTYNDFKVGAAKSRQAMVYTGANDGMLHGFNALTGDEVFAYIPNSVFSSTSTEGLHFLTDTNYTHRYYVDMPIVISDAYISNKNQSQQWRTVLIGGGRKGTRGLFALDITHPDQISENQSDLVLWEFDHTDDPNLGFTYSKPNVALLNNGRWGVIFGNGYNSTEVESTGDGTSSLFILFLDGADDGKWEEGADKDYIRISTQAGSNNLTNCDDCNGLSTPVTIDLNADKVIDRVYAGDLQGNMWAFDLSSTNAQDWGVSYGTSEAPKPLFIAEYDNKRQPITNKPAVVTHPEGIGDKNPNLLVYFGTGQYLTDQDPANQDVQSFYGVWDNGKDSLTSSTLVEQTFISGTAVTNDDNQTNITSQVRVLTDNEVDYSTKQGWFINLTLKQGERVVIDPLVFGGLVFFNTWIPDSNPCGAGGYGFLMNAKLLNGGPTEEEVFDFNEDGNIDAKDLVVIDGKTYPPNGYIFTHGLPLDLGIIGKDNDRVSFFTTGTDGDLDEKDAKLPGARKTGRLSWQELRQ